MTTNNPTPGSEMPIPQEFIEWTKASAKKELPLNYSQQQDYMAGAMDAYRHLSPSTEQEKGMKEEERELGLIKCLLRGEQDVNRQLTEAFRWEQDKVNILEKNIKGLQQSELDLMAKVESKDQQIAQLKEERDEYRKVMEGLNDSGFGNVTIYRSGKKIKELFDKYPKPIQ